jgi:prolyl oligopeptidase
MRAMSSLPVSSVEPVLEFLHGVPISDPYRWLEDQDSSETRAWIAAQTAYARSYLDAIPGRDRIREQIRGLLDRETYDSFVKGRTKYFFRKRLPGQEQPCIYFREGLGGEDRLLIDPAMRGTGSFTSVRPLRISHDESLLLYEVKQGGERTGVFELLDVASRRRLSDSLPHGFLRGFAFDSDNKGFFYVHEATNATRPSCRAVYHHAFGTAARNDREVFCAEEGKHVRLTIVPGREQLGFLVCRSVDETYTDFYTWSLTGNEPPLTVLRNAAFGFAPRFSDGRLLAETSLGAPNHRIVEVLPRFGEAPLFIDLVPENDAAIRSWVVTNDRVFVSFAFGTKTKIRIFDVGGKPLGEIPCQEGQTLRLVGGEFEGDDVLLERESFTHPIEFDRYSTSTSLSSPWITGKALLDQSSFSTIEVSFTSTDGAQIPLSLVGRHDVLDGGAHPTIMTSYGGYGIPVTPQFSTFVAFFLTHGCLFALPNIRGGGEFGAKWHTAARRRNRQVAFNDFLAAAEWLVKTGKTDRTKLAIFGGSNSGLLVGTAMTQRPDLFCAVLCMVPILDMLRYHLFDNSVAWKREFGTADDADDFAALSRYSPYHAVRDAIPYPATMIVSGDADGTCNPLHARKMVARLQAASASARPVLLDYSQFRGHSPVLPLSMRIEALTDRISFLSHQLGLLT